LKDKYILALDQGTTSSRAMLYNQRGEICSMAQKEIEQIYPNPDQVEHNPIEIWESQLQVAIEAMKGISEVVPDIVSIGITNQRETTIIWDRISGKPIYNAIVWQDRRTTPLCQSLKDEGYEEKIRKKTGLQLDPYFSATKIKWILDSIPGCRAKAENGDLAFGNVDSWLLWNLTGGKIHATDVSNASRTMLFNIIDLKWDKELLLIFDIPETLLPAVVSSSEVIGTSSDSVFPLSVPISGIAGDQQAALFGQMCIEKGMVKNTYGTGCFLMMNIGEEPVLSKNGMLTTIAWEIKGQLTYALEGSVFSGGAVVQWLRDGLGMIKESSEIEELANSVKDNGGVYFVPAFTGLGAPWWAPGARGLLSGLSRGTNKGHLARAALESIAFQSYDLLHAMEDDSGFKVKKIRVDGGASKNNFLMQFQADLQEAIIERPANIESTSLGAAYLAGLAVGFWKDIDEIALQWKLAQSFESSMNREIKESMISNWNRVLSASIGISENNMNNDKGR